MCSFANASLYYEKSKICTCREETAKLKINHDRGGNSPAAHASTKHEEKPSDSTDSCVSRRELKRVICISVRKSASLLGLVLRQHDNFVFIATTSNLPLDITQRDTYLEADGRFLTTSSRVQLKSHE